MGDEPSNGDDQKPPESDDKPDGNDIGTDSSSSRNSPHPQPTTNKKQNYSVSNKFNIAMFVVALLAAFFAGWQVKITKDTAHKQLRAYVFVKPYQWVNAVGEGQRFNSTVWVRNGGQTPASQATLRVNVEVRTDSPQNRRSVFLAANKQENVDPVLDPSTDVKGRGLIPSDAPLTLDQFSAVIIGKEMMFYVWGAITYKDVFGEPHHSFFCYFYYGHELNIREGGMSSRYRGTCPHPNSQ